MVGWEGKEKVQGADVIIVWLCGAGSRSGDFPVNFPISAVSVEL